MLHHFCRPNLALIFWIVGTTAEDQGADSMRIPKPNQTHTIDEICRGITAPTLLHDISAGAKDGLDDVATVGKDAIDAATVLLRLLFLLL